MPLLDRARKAWKKVEAWAEEDEQRPAPAPAQSDATTDAKSTAHQTATPDAPSQAESSPVLPMCYTNTNATVTSAYTYKPLSADAKGQIRLLTLLPGLPDADIKCLVTVGDLNNVGRGSPHFEALSYVWGDTSPEKLTPIQIDDAILPVGRNLRSALLHLRDEEQPRTLWVDAICINQDDFDEKGRQVPLMGEIYRRATRAVVWLGCPCCVLGVDGQVMSSYRRVEQADKFDYVLDLFNALELLDQQAAIVATEGRQVVPRKGEQYEAIRKLALKWDYVLWDNPWWARVWTLQEIVLARDAVLCMSIKEVRWESFRRAIAHYQALGFSVFHGGWFGNKKKSGLEPLNMVISIQTALESQVAVHRDIGDELLSYLASSHGRESTAPHDKIYAVLGFFSKGRNPGIDVDYRSNPADAYRAATKKLLEQSGNLDALGFCYPYKPPIVVNPRPTGVPTLPSWEDLPSWVPNWGSAGNLATPLMHDAKGNPRTTHASRGLRSSPRWEDDGRTLILKGHIVDTITKLGSVKPGNMFDDRNEGAMDFWVKDPEVMAAMEATPATWDDLDPDRPIQHLVSEYWKAIKIAGPKMKNVMSTVTSHIVMLKEHYIEWQDMLETELQGTSGPAPVDVFREVLSTSTPCPSGEAETKRRFDKWIEELSLVRKLKGVQVDRISPGMFKTIALASGFWNAADEEDDSFSTYTEHTVRRRLGFTQNGRVCLLPSRVELGDKIALIQGGRVPVVLRARGDSGSRELIGEAFVHGIMDGEAFEEGKCVNFSIL